MELPYKSLVIHYISQGTFAFSVPQGIFVIVGGGATVLQVRSNCQFEGGRDDRY